MRLPWPARKVVKKLGEGSFGKVYQCDVAVSAGKCLLEVVNGSLGPPNHGRQSMEDSHIPSSLNSSIPGESYTRSPADFGRKAWLPDVGMCLTTVCHVVLLDSLQSQNRTSAKSVGDCPEMAIIGVPITWLRL